MSYVFLITEGDFEIVGGVLSFPPGAPAGSTVCFTLEIIADQVTEPDEFFQLFLFGNQENLDVLQVTILGGRFHA